MIVADANIAIAVLNPQDLHHRSALERCVSESSIAILNLTLAEALIHPTRAGRHDAAAAELERLGFQSHLASDDVADQARELRARYGNRNFPIVDAVVVGLGIVLGVPVLTTDARWPEIKEASIEVVGR